MRQRLCRIKGKFPAFTVVNHYRSVTRQVHGPGECAMLDLNSPVSCLHGWWSVLNASSNDNPKRNFSSSDQL
jgi:hypothetical protein